MPHLAMGRVGARVGQVQLGPALATPVVRGKSAAVEGQQRGSEAAVARQWGALRGQ